MSREYIYKCDECGKVLSVPNDLKQSVEHLHVRNGQVFFAYYDKSSKSWKEEKLPTKCDEHQFCNGKCLGRFIDKQIGKVTEKIRR